MSQQREALAIRAPAKINLYLEVLGQRPDGYHELRSVVVPISICDELILERAAGGGIELTVEDAGAANGRALAGERALDNLAVRAARILQAAAGCPHGARLRLIKRIPVGGGLGGGSADAAAALVGLNRLWGTGLDRPALMRLGARVGCDVPALAHGGAVCMEGAGDRITPLPARAGAAWWVVVANPGFGVSTKDIYARYRGGLTAGEKTYKEMCFALETGDLDRAARSLFNSLQATVCRKYPLIALLAEGLRKAGAAGALVSGSGASVFGLAAGEEAARQIVERLPSLLGFPAWIQAAKVLPDGVMVAHGPLEA